MTHHLEIHDVSKTFLSGDGIPLDQRTSAAKDSKEFFDLRNDILHVLREEYAHKAEQEARAS